MPERLDELAHLPLWIAWAEDDEIARLTAGSREVVARLQGCGRLIARPYHLGSASTVTARTCAPPTPPSPNPTCIGGLRAFRRRTAAMR